MRFVAPVLVLLAPFAAAQGGLQAGLQLYAEGKYEAAAAALREAEATHADSPELQYDLALASWRAGDLAAAETAIEKYAALSRRPRVDLHAGLLGAVRFDEARRLEASAEAPPAAGASAAADPVAVLEQALAKAKQAQDHFVRGAVAANSPELRRNAERALRYAEELQQKIDERKKQQQEQKQDDTKDEKQDGKKDDKKSDPKDDPQGKSEPGQPKPDPSGQESQQPSGEGQEGEKPEPEPKGEPKEPEPPQPQQPGKPEQDKQQTQDQQAAPRSDAPGEQQGERELSPEQTQRLLELLQQLDGKLDGIRARAKSRRPKVEKDW